MSLKWKSVFQPDDEAGEGDHGGECGVKFFIASGDWTKGFEAGKEIVDSVAFMIAR